MSSSSSSTDEVVVLETYSTEDFETASYTSDFVCSVSMTLGPFELFSLLKLWLSTKSSPGRLTCCRFPLDVSGIFSTGLACADFARCGKRVTCGRRSSP